MFVLVQLITLAHNYTGTALHYHPHDRSAGFQNMMGSLSSICLALHPLHASQNTIL